MDENKGSNTKKIIIAILIALFVLSIGFVTFKKISSSKANKDVAPVVDVIKDESKDDSSSSSSDTDTKKEDKTEVVVKEEVTEYFNVIFCLKDGTILQNSLVKKGEIASYFGPTPKMNGYKFIGWDKKQTPIYADTTYTAKFEQIEDDPTPTVYYTVKVIAGDHGFVSMGGENKKQEITKKYASNAYCTVIATPNNSVANGVSYFAFEKWSDDSTANPYSFRVTKDIELTATFVEGYEVKYKDYITGVTTIYIPGGTTLTVDTRGDLPISENPKEASSTISAKVDISNKELSTENYTFLGFDYSSSDKKLSAKYQKKILIKTDVTLNSAKNKSTVFGHAYNILSSEDPDYYTNPSDSVKYDKGSKVLIYALPVKNDCDFVGWKLNGKIISYENPLEIDADFDKTYVAEYKEGFDYLHFENTSSNDGVVSMQINGFESDVYHIRTATDEDTGKPDLIFDDGNVCVDDAGDDLSKTKIQEEIQAGKTPKYSLDGYKHVKLTVPELQLEYRVDKYDGSTGSYKYGFWNDFNLREEDLEIGEEINEDNCYKKIELGQNDRISVRAKKTVNGYTATRISAFEDCPTHGLEGEKYYFYYNDSQGQKKRSDISICIASHVFTFKDKVETKNTEYKASGAITSILDGVGKHYTNIETINGGTQQDHYFTFGALFVNQTRLKNIEELKLNIEDTTLGCYYALFQGTGITSIPGSFSSYPEEGQDDTNEYFLPDRELTNSCYAYMFKDCKGLIDISNFVLPATDASGRCYFCMFEGCTNLTTINEKIVSNCKKLMNQKKYNEMLEIAVSDPSPENLKAFNDFAMTQAKCYYSMFKNCTSLVTIPELPAIVIEPYCYESMFYNCYNLNNNGSDAPGDMVVDLPAYYLYDYCYAHMFECDYGKTSYINNVKLGCYSIGLNRERDPLNEAEYFETIHSCAGFLGSIKEDPNAETGTSVKKFSGVYSTGELHTTAYVDPNDCYFMNSEPLKNGWTCNKTVEFPDIYLPEGVDPIPLNLNSCLTFNISDEEMIINDTNEDNIEEEPVDEINEDVVQEEETEEIVEVIEKEKQDEIIPIEHKEEDTENPLEEQQEL